MGLLPIVILILLIGGLLAAAAVYIQKRFEGGN